MSTHLKFSDARSCAVCTVNDAGCLLLDEDELEVLVLVLAPSLAQPSNSLIAFFNINVVLSTKLFSAILARACRAMSFIYIWSKNFSHSSIKKVKPNMAEIEGAVVASRYHLCQKMKLNHDR